MVQIRHFSQLTIARRTPAAAIQSNDRGDSRLNLSSEKSKRGHTPSEYSPHKKHKQVHVAKKETSADTVGRTRPQLLWCCRGCGKANGSEEGRMSVSALFCFWQSSDSFSSQKKKKCIDNFMTFVKVAFYLLDKLYFQLWCWSLLCLLLFFFFFLQSWCLSSFPSDCPGTALTWD